MPDGADTVVIQEDVTRSGDSVTVPAIKPGQNIRHRALDFKAGTQLLQAGRRLDGISLAAGGSIRRGDAAGRARAAHRHPHRRRRIGPARENPRPMADL